MVSLLLGSMIKAKYDGQCKICGAVWNVGDDLYYQRTPKAICTDHECYTEQGGKNGFQTTFKRKERDTIVAKIPDIEVSDDIKIQADEIIRLLKSLIFPLLQLLISLNSGAIMKR